MAICIASERNYKVCVQFCGINLKLLSLIPIKNVLCFWTSVLLSFKKLQLLKEQGLNFYFKESHWKWNLAQKKDHQGPTRTKESGKHMQ